MKKWIIGGILVVGIVGIGIMQLRNSEKEPDQSLPITGIQATTTTSEPSSPPAPISIPKPAPFTGIALLPGDAIASWDFKGAYTGNPELESKADAELARLQSLMGSQQYPDYVLYVSMANQYDLKGDGRQELAYLEKALAIDSTRTGLAWYNAGQLLKRLGAYRTARVAFERAATVQPVAQYQKALTDFLKTHFPSDTSAIKASEQVQDQSNRAGIQ